MSSTEQSRADALADAETLRINARNYGYGPTVYRALRAAEESAEWALMEADPLGRIQQVYAHTAAAARAAFRAVPGLRG